MQKSDDESRKAAQTEVGKAAGEAFARLFDPASVAAAVEIVRQAAESLPTTLDKIQRENANVPGTFAAKRARVEQEIKRGARAVGPDGRPITRRIF